MGEMNGAKLWIDGVEHPVESLRFEARPVEIEPAAGPMKPTQFECTMEFKLDRTQGEAWAEFYRHLEEAAWKRIREWFAAAVLAERTHRRRLRSHVRRCWRGKARRRAMRALEVLDDR